VQQPLAPNVTPPEGLYSVKRKPPDVAMTNTQYQHVQQLIRRELGSRFESSGWFALSLAGFGVATTILITVWATAITSSANKGKLETAGWLIAAFAVFCLVIHVVKRKDCDERAQDIIDMTDRYNMEVESQQPIATGTVPAVASNLSEAATSAMSRRAG
jgi:CHASE1-domain containing sensor protein